jgi:hypothetical protein
LIVRGWSDPKVHDEHAYVTHRNKEDAVRSRAVDSKDISESGVRETPAAVVCRAAVEAEASIALARRLALDANKRAVQEVDHEVVWMATSERNEHPIAPRNEC